MITNQANGGSPASSIETPTLCVAVSGSHGLIGSAAISRLSSQGHEITRLTRDAPPALDGVDAVIHLAGENIASGRWDERKKKMIRDSRVRGTRHLAESIAKLGKPPKVLLCASAIGFYGDRGAEELNEASGAGRSFLSHLCSDWEHATCAARERGIRVVYLRFGVVLSKEGGALAKMMPPFLVGAGGNIGSGRQYMSWIDIDDVAAAIQHCLTDDSLNGPVNVVAPNPVTNAQFTRALGKVLHRPTIFPMPAFAARLVLGQMADELLLASTKVKPAKLLDTGFQFAYPDIEASLRHVLNR